MMAEVVRGGLNSIPKGQFEAAASQGFTLASTLWYIVIPQCFRRIIPTMMSQVITVIKDTSFLAQVAIGELLFNTKDLMAKLPVYTGQAIGFPGSAAFRLRHAVILPVELYPFLHHALYTKTQ